jgi:raffinose/stachyose/melibiose transport system substrate-binding protein
MMKHIKMTATAIATVMALNSAAQAQMLTILAGDTPDTIANIEALVAAFGEKNPDVSFDVEFRPGGADGDNIIKSRLATGEMADVFTYNTGSLFQAIRPDRNLMPITQEDMLNRVLDSFEATVTSPDGDIFGVPFGAAMGGGIFYNRGIYDELGLEVPRSWDEFMSNNAKIAEAGKVPVAQTYGDTWTSQLFVLADYYNVQAAEPDFAERYTANQAKYAESEAAMRGFKYLQDVYEAGYLNEDFGAASFPDGMRMVATGEAAHYPMLTFAVGTVQQNNPENINDIGFFAQPGASADTNGLTVWMPTAMYVSKDAEEPELAKEFLSFVASQEGCEVMMATTGATGPYLIDGCSLPDDVPAAIADMLPYFKEGGNTAPALEFVSPIKGPNLENLTVEVGSGIRSAEDAAKLYDLDVVKQAKQLGLPGA